MNWTIPGTTLTENRDNADHVEEMFRSMFSLSFRNEASRSSSVVRFAAMRPTELKPISLPCL